MLCGNCDFECHDNQIEPPDSVKVCVLQNSYTSDAERIFKLPTSFEKAMLGGGGFPRNFDIDAELG